MSNFDEFKKVAKETMETIADRSVELYKIAEEKTKIIAKRTKLSAEIAVEKGGVRNLYKEIGKMYYDNHKDAPEEPLADMCAEVGSAMDRITEKQQELDDLKTAASYSAEYTSPPTDDEPPVTEETAEPADEEPAEAPPSGTYNATPQDDTDKAPPEDGNTTQQNDWQKKYPPEFRL